MKRTLRLTSLFLALVLLMLTLSSCGGQGGLPAVGDMTYHFDTDYHPDQPTVAEGTDAYYFLKGDFLYFWDKSGGEPMALCNKPNCLHDKEVSDEQKYNCHAYVGDSHSLTFYDGALYLVARGEYGPPKPYGGVHLRKFSLQGDYLEDVFDLPNSELYTAIHRGCFYYIKKDISDAGGGDTNATDYLMQVSLSDKSERCLYSTDFINGSISHISCFGRYLFFFSSGLDAESFDESKPETAKTIQQLLCYDLETNQLSQIDTKPGEAIAGYPAVKDGALYYSYWYYDYGDERNKVLYRNLPDGSKEEAVFDLPCCVSIYTDGDCFYVDNWPILGEAGFEDEVRTIWAYDGDFNEICSFSTAEVDGIDCTDWRFDETNVTGDYLLFLKTGYDPEEESVLVTVSKKDIAAGNPVPHAFVF